MDSQGFVQYFILFVIVLILILAYQGQTAEYLTVRSREDNREYVVQKGPDQQDAADTLARIGERLVRLQRHIVDSYPDDERAIQLNELFDPENLVEADLDGHGTSYTINKGEKVVICLRRKDGSQQIESFNTLMFVAIHEFAHILTESIGHTEEFWDNFAWVLKEAVRIGVWEFQDFSETPRMYCGVNITSTPISKEEAHEAMMSGPESFQNPADSDDDDDEDTV